MSKKSIIIGGAGFIGSHLTDVCLANGHQVWVYDNFASGKREFLTEHPNLTIVEADMLDQDFLNNTISSIGPDIVFHLAAIHFIPLCEEQPATAIQVNIEGTQRVLNACANKVPRVVFTSTGAIYDPEITTALNENSNISTKDVYGLTKHTGERLVEHYVRKGRGQAVIARLFNAVGRRETNPHLIPAIMEQLLKGDRRIELGNLYPRRDYIHVEDIAEALFALGILETEEPIDIFNVGSGIEFSVGELVESCGKAINEDIEIVSVPARRRKYDRPNQLADLGHIKAKTGWEPKRNLRQALEEIWALETALETNEQV
jgi:UDP-glucose 4-epimerase